VHTHASRSRTPYATRYTCGAWSVRCSKSAFQRWPGTVGGGQGWSGAARDCQCAVIGRPSEGGRGRSVRCNKPAFRRWPSGRGRGRSVRCNKPAFRRWPRMAGDGRRWPRMAGGGQGWPEMARNGQGLSVRFDGNLSCPRLSNCGHDDVRRMVGCGARLAWSAAG